MIPGMDNLRNIHCNNSFRAIKFADLSIKLMIAIVSHTVITIGRDQNARDKYREFCQNGFN